MYSCGTCGDTTLVIRVVEAFPNLHGPKFQWLISCNNGHELVPVPGEVIVLETGR